MRAPRPAELAEVNLTVVRGPDPDDASVWYWRARTKGAERRVVWTGWATRDEAMRVVGELVAHGLPAPQNRPHGTVETVGDMLNDWIAFQKTLYEEAGGSAYTYKHCRTACRHLVKWLEDTRLAAVTRVTVETYIAKRYGEQIAKKGRRAPRTVLQEEKVFAMAWNWSIAKYGRQFLGTPTFPWVRIKIDKKEHVNNHATPRDSDLFKVAELVVDPVTRLVLDVLIETGARIGEVGPAPAANLDLCAEGGPELLLKGKTGIRRWPLTPELARKLVVATQDCLPTAPMFPWPVTDYRSKVLRELEDACALAGVPRFTPHGIRRAAVRRARRRGVGVKVAAELFGQSATMMMEIYDELEREEARGEAARGRLGILDGSSRQ